MMKQMVLLILFCAIVVPVLFSFKNEDYAEKYESLYINRFNDFTIQLDTCEMHSKLTKLDDTSHIEKIA